MADKPIKGLHHSERRLWEATDDPQVREVLARLQRFRATTKSLRSDYVDLKRVAENTMAYLEGCDYESDVEKEFLEILRSDLHRALYPADA